MLRRALVVMEFALALAWGGLQALLAVAPANLPRLESVGLNPVACAFAVLLGLGAAAVFASRQRCAVLEQT